MTKKPDDEITICDLTVTGAQDTAIASLAMQRCSEGRSWHDLRDVIR